MFKWVLAVLCVVLGLAFFQAERLLLLTDLSTRPIDPVAVPDYRPNPDSPRISARPPVYLVSYADGGEVYFQNQLALAQSAQGRGVDFVLNYKRSLIDPKFIEENREIMDSKAGAGYWLWKPWVILDAMKRAPENAVIIYMDGGCIIKGSLMPLVEKVQKDPILLCDYDTDEYGSAFELIKKEMFKQIDPEYEKYKTKPQKFAAFIVLKNTELSRKFISTWLEFCTHKELIMNGGNGVPEYPGYKAHMHDQSILNVVAGRYPEGVQTIKYKEHLLNNYIYWVHRRPGAIDIDTSIVPYYGYFKMRKFDRIFFNSPILMKIRHWMREKRK